MEPQNEILVERNVVESQLFCDTVRAMLLISVTLVDSLGWPAGKFLLFVATKLNRDCQSMVIDVQPIFISESEWVLTAPSNKFNYGWSVWVFLRRTCTCTGHANNVERVGSRLRGPVSPVDSVANSCSPPGLSTQYLRYCNSKARQIGFSEQAKSTYSHVGATTLY